jgi:hypothetical protein
MKTEDAIRHAGGTVKALAEILEITPSAISQWGETVPEPRVWQLKVLRPTWFTEPAANSPRHRTEKAA